MVIPTEDQTNKTLELREQLQEDILTIFLCSHYEHLNDKLKDQLCEVICNYFLDVYGV